MQSNNKDIVFGRHPVVEAIQSGMTIDKVLLQQGTRGDFERDIRHLTRDFDIPLQVVPRERLNRVTRSNHQGVIALVSAIRYYRIADVLPGIYERSETPLIVIVDGVTDVRNFGAIARSAEICGAHAIVMGKKKSAQVSADAVKTSAGALTKIPVCRENSLMEAIELLQMSGVRVLASDLKASKPIFELGMKGPIAVVLGSEGQGISRAIAEKADELFIIPQKGETDSFNVSVAAGIMLYEATRQRF